MSSSLQTASSSTRRRQRKGEDEKLARNLAAVQALTSSRGKGNRGFGRRSKSRNDSSNSRLKFLLSILLVTTILLIMLQAFRHFSSPSKSNSSIQSKFRKAQEAIRSKQVGRGGMDWADTSKKIVGEAKESGIATNFEREQKIEDRQNPLNWKSYLASMKKHFNDELMGKTVTTDEYHTSSPIVSTGGGGGGMAIVPGQQVQDHKVKSTIDLQNDQDIPSVPGKSDEEAKRDRKIALEDIDQETLKAMFDALYGRG